MKRRDVCINGTKFSNQHIVSDERDRCLACGCKFVATDDPETRPRIIAEEPAWKTDQAFEEFMRAREASLKGPFVFKYPTEKDAHKAPPAEG